MVMNEPFGLREAINGVIRLTQIGLRENNLFSRLNADSLDFYIGMIWSLNIPYDGYFVGTWSESGLKIFIISLLLVEPQL